MRCGALSGRIAIVTGADPGIGAAVSRALSKSGASVVLAGREGPSLAALAADISASGGHAVAVSMDVTNSMSVRRMIEQTLGAFGRLDAAFNHGQAHGVSLAMTYQIPAMLRTGGGRIVNLAPSTGTQAAVIELTRATALQLPDSGLRINALIAQPHAGAEEVADAVVWLCSGDASLVTGDTWHVPDECPRLSGR